MFSAAKGTHLFCILRDSEGNFKNTLHELDGILSFALSLLLTKWIFVLQITVVVTLKHY